MRTITASHFRENAGRVVDKVHYAEEVVLVTRYGKPVAALIPFTLWEAFNTPQPTPEPAQEPDDA